MCKENYMIPTKMLAVSAFLFGAIALGAFSFIGSASADDSPSRTSLIERLVAKFNLKTSDVESVFAEHREDRQEKKQAQFEARLSEAVTKGTITEEQKSLILAKRKELQEKRDALRDTWKNMTREERHTAMEQHRTELDTWMKANHIPDGIFGLEMGMGKMGRGGHGMGWNGTEK